MISSSACPVISQRTLSVGIFMLATLLCSLLAACTDDGVKKPSASINQAQHRTLPQSVVLLDGSTQRLDNHEMVLVVFLTHQCPIANDYQPTLGRLSAKVKELGGITLGVHVDPDLTDQEATDHAKAYSITYPLLIDRDHKLVARLKATVTPSVYLFDKGGNLAYSGRIDDRFPSIGVKRDPTTHDLAEMIDIVNSKKFAVRVTTPVGCAIPDLPNEDR